MKKLYKVLLSCAVILFFIAIIYTFSEQPGTDSHSLSQDTAKRIISLLLSGTSNSDDTILIDTIAHAFDQPVRKLAHICIYCMLGFIATWLMWFNVDFNLRFRHIICVIALVFLVGAGDEIIQYFSGGRGSAFLDVLIDTFGGIIGIWAHFIIRDIVVHFRNGIRKERIKRY